jgi:hypothetical protein
MAPTVVACASLWPLPLWQIAAKTWLATWDPKAARAPTDADMKYLKEFLRRKYTEKECVKWSCRARAALLMSCWRRGVV